MAGQPREEQPESSEAVSAHAHRSSQRRTPTGVRVLLSAEVGGWGGCKGADCQTPAARRMNAPSPPPTLPALPRARSLPCLLPIRTPRCARRALGLGGGARRALARTRDSADPVSHCKALPWGKKWVGGAGGPLPGARYRPPRRDFFPTRPSPPTKDARARPQGLAAARAQLAGCHAYHVPPPRQTAGRLHARAPRVRESLRPRSSDRSSDLIDRSSSKRSATKCSRRSVHSHRLGARGEVLRVARSRRGKRPTTGARGSNRNPCWGSNERANDAICVDSLARASHARPSATDPPAVSVPFHARRLSRIPRTPAEVGAYGGIGGRTACSRIRAAGRGLERLPGRGAPKACDLTAQPQSDDKVSWGAKLVAATSPLWYQSVEYHIVANDGTLKFSLFCRWRCGHFPADPKRATPRIYVWGRVFPGSIYAWGRVDRWSPPALERVTPRIYHRYCPTPIAEPKVAPAPPAGAAVCLKTN